MSRRFFVFPTPEGENVDSPGGMRHQCIPGIEGRFWIIALEKLNTFSIMDFEHFRPKKNVAKASIITLWIRQQTVKGGVSNSSALFRVMETDVEPLTYFPGKVKKTST